MKTGKNNGKYIVIALVIVLLLAAAFLFLKAWENGLSDFFNRDDDEKILEYQGEKYVMRDDINTFLVLGLDKYKDATSSDSHESGTIQADFLMLFIFDNTAKKTTALHINRDTMANVNHLDVAGNKIGIVEKKQIALAYNYAYKNEGSVNCRNTADSVSDLLLGIKVDHYISLTMDSVVEMNDLVGGVEVTVLDDFTGIDDSLVKGQKVTLTGEQALKYVRTRYGLEDDTNNTRMARQQQYMDALLEKLRTCEDADDAFVLKAADKLKPYLEYDSTDYRLKEYAERFNDYEFMGIRDLEGELKQGEEFMEFYPDETFVLETVIELFCEPKRKAK